jgi:regulator of RNase E activity RraA
MAADADTIEILKGVSTNSLATVLLKKGVRNVWVRGPRPLDPKQKRAVGPAFTLRFIPTRDDVQGAKVTRDAVESMPAGSVIIADARGVTDVGTFGDIVVTRIAKRGIAAIVSDGAVRDSAGLLATGLPIWCAGLSAPPPVAGHILAGWQEPISCGGVAVFPDDLVVADAEGVVIVPARLAAEVAKAGVELEEEDERLLSAVRGGASLSELYPAKKEKK